MRQIAEWLDELGLSEHTERFVENKIDVAALSLLTDEDLKEIGIPLGHRRKILAAINQRYSRGTAHACSWTGTKH